MQKKILLLDDDREFCEELVDILEEEGFSVLTAHHAATLDKLVEENSFDAFILDFKLPEINGVQALRMLKLKIPDAKVLMITGRPFMHRLLEEENLSGLIAGFFNKPFDVDKLISSLRSL